MPKVFGREVSNGAIGIVAVITVALVATQLTGGSGSAAAARRTTKKTTTTKSKNDPYTDEDRKAKFVVLTEDVKPAFRPLVLRNAPAAKGMGGGANFLPSDLTGGDATWAYTGYGEVDGVRQGLLENGTTGESVYLKVGQRWKQLTVQAITEEQMKVTGSDGESHTIPVGDLVVPEQKMNSGVTPSGGVAPMNPAGALSGSIPGIPGAATPVPGVATAPGTDLRLQPDPTQGDGSTNFGRRGRRRGNN